MATIPAVLLAFTVSWQLALVTLVVCIVFSQSLDVRPVTVIIALLVGGALGGFWGLMLAIPFAAFLQLLYRDYYLNSKWYKATNGRGR